MGVSQEKFFKSFDLFGVMFNFRMPNYQKFRTKSGAFITILCVLCCILLSYYDLIILFDSDKNFTERIYFDKRNNEDFDIELNCFLTLLKNLIEVL